MNLFYVEENQINESGIIILGDDVNHMKNVLRMHPGEQVMVCDSKGSNYLCKIDSFPEKQVMLSVIEKKEAESELPVKLYLFLGLPKSDKMELIIQKAVELGVHEVIPVAMKRSIVKIEDKKKEAKKLERWQAIATAAAKQSKRGIIPLVHHVLSYGEALQYAKDMDMKLFPYENAVNINQSKELIRKAPQMQSIAVFIGPEGGFEDKEIEDVTAIGGQVITLGKRILRTETAGLTTMSLLMFEIENSEQVNTNGSIFR